MLRCGKRGACREKKSVSCLREPCPRFGQCFVEGETDALSKAECDVSTNDVTDDCAKVHMELSKEKLPKVNIFLITYCSTGKQAVKTTF